MYMYVHVYRRTIAKSLFLNDLLYKFGLSHRKKQTFYCAQRCIIDAIVRKRAKIRNRYNQEPHSTQDTNGKVTTLQLDITNESQEVSPFPAGDHKASTNRHA